MPHAHAPQQKHTQAGISLQILRESSTTDQDLKIYPRWLLRALRHIDENYADDLDLTSIANAAGISKFSLAKQFERHLGTTPVKWLWRHRIQMAKHYLATELDWEVREVAYAAGFTCDAHFCRYFKSVVGLTPTLFRETFSRRTCASQVTA